MKKIAVVNGPNLNFLGIRDKSVYGNKSYDDLIHIVKNHCHKKDVSVATFQSNCEGAIIDFLQQCYYDGIEGIVINPGAFTHYSYAIRDAINSVQIPTVEVHISNVYEREPFRAVSVTKDVCVKQIYGKGLEGYLEGIDYLLNMNSKEDE